VDQRERFDDFEEVIRQAIRGFLAHVMTAAPVRIESFDPATATADATLLQMVMVQQLDGSWEWKPGPMLTKCPIVFPSGAGFTFFAPPQAGDEALAIFASRSIDEWWARGGQQQRGDLRMHSPNDAFILAGVWNQTRVPTAIDPTALEIRNAAGTVKLRMESAGVTITAPLVTVAGDLAVTGNVLSGTVSLETHVHSGVQSGGSDTGPPLP
jgi:hypothetical protein